MFSIKFNRIMNGLAASKANENQSSRCLSKQFRFDRSACT